MKFVNEDPGRQMAERFAHLQEPIDKAVHQGYPLVDSRNMGAQDALKRFDPQKTPLHSDNSLTRIAFDPTKYRHPLTNEAIQIALTRAATESDPAFARHGAEHVPFAEAIRRMTDVLQKREAVNITWQPVMVESNLRPELEFRADRLVMETEHYIRSSARPAPYISAVTEVRPRAGAQDKALRKIARDGDHGVARALLAGTYAEMSPDEIFHALDDANLKRDLSARKIRTLTRNRPGDFQILLKLKEVLHAEVEHKLILRRSSDSYLQALTVLEQAALLPRDAYKMPGFGFDEFRDVTNARVVFVGLSEIAQQVAPPEYLDPLRTSWIDKHFGRLATSIVATAYLPQEV